MTPDAGILTYILTSFLSVFSGGFGSVLPHAKHLLFLMAGIELTLAALFWALKGENLMVPLIQKTLVIGLFTYFVLNWPSLINAVLSGFVFTGQVAGSGGGGGSLLSLTNPSAIISQGFTAISPISAAIAALPWYSVGDLFLLGWAMIFTLIAFFIIGIQCFITYLEFYIVAVLALILVPFGVFKHTAFLAEKSLGIIISHGVKLMVLAFIISAASPVLASISTVLPAAGTVTIAQAYSILLASMAIAFLAWHAPALAGGMMSGGPSLNAGTAVGTAVSAGIGAGLGFAGARAAAGSIASGGASATMSAARGLGAASTAGELGAATAAMGGAGVVGQTVGAARGVASAATGAIKGAAMSPAGAVVQSFKQAFSQGRLGGYKATGGKTAAQVNATPPTPPASTGGGNFASAARMASSAVPPVAGAGPGISVPLNTP